MSVICRFAVGMTLLHRRAGHTRPLPLEERRDRLATILQQRPSASLMFSGAVEDDKGALLFRHACEKNLEGIVSKRKGSPYISGPTSTWRKVKCPDYVRAGEENVRSRE